MKPGAKRRRSKITIEQQKRDALLQKQEIEAKLAELERFKERDDAFERKRQRLEDNELMVQQMFEAGVIKTDQSDQIVEVQDQRERAQIVSKSKAQRQQ